ncbi:hypothetical protein [Streptomyces cinereoruber]|uniref:hypothetical protein n=1 Tax=Streptomyces cinereoruber TaxID=67260 RepID=UPI003641550F
MTNTSHTHDRIPTNDPNPWALLASLVAFCLLLGEDADRIIAAAGAAGGLIQAVGVLRRPE